MSGRVSIATLMAFVGAAILAVGLVILSGRKDEPVVPQDNAGAAPTIDDYDYQTSINRLRAIGAALKLYRQEYGYKPVEKRRTYSDAGLPTQGLYVFAKLPGHAWSLTDRLELFKAPEYGLKGHFVSDFTELYSENPEIIRQEGEISAFYRSRGERLPVFADCCMNLAPRTKPAKYFRAVILRLDGTVETVSYDPTIRRALMSK